MFLYLFSFKITRYTREIRRTRARRGKSFNIDELLIFNKILLRLKVSRIKNLIKT
jgi:hypothetical protein